MNEASRPHSTRDLLVRLQQVLTRQRQILLLAGLCTVLAIGVAAWFLLSLIAAFVVLPVWLKLSLLALAVAAVIAPAIRWFVKSMRHGSVESTALALESKYPDLKGQLIAAVQFAMQPQPEGYSAELVEATHVNAVQRSSEIDFASVTSTAPLVRSSRYAGLAMVATIITLFAFPAFFRYAVEVYANPLTKVAPPVPYALFPLSNGGEVVRFADLEIGGLLIGERLPRAATLRYRLEGGDWQTESINLIDQSSALKRVSLGSRGDSIRVALALRKVSAAVEYQLKAGELETELVRIAVVDRPHIESMALTVYPPSYTKRPTLNLPANEGNGSAITGSRVVIQATTNDPMTEATLVIDDTIRQVMTITDKSIETTITLDRSLSYHVELRNRLNETNPDPIRYALTAQPDLYPSIDVLKPGTDVTLSDAMGIPILLHISDDFGFSSLALKFTLTQDGKKAAERVAVLHYPSTITTDGDIDFNWDLSSLKMFPGDQVVYYFEVTDNDRVSGPKTSKSKEYIARYPSLEEITYQAETGGEERISKTEEILREGKQLAERLKQTTRKLEAEQKNSAKPEWQQQQEIDATAKAQEELIKKIDSVAKSMDEQMEKLRDQAVMSREVMEKMEAIQKLFEEVATPEMREAQKKLQDALKSMDKQQIEEAMKEYQESQQEMLERLDRTLALLKKMQLEQKMEAMIRKAEELLREQEALNDQTEKKDPKELAELAPKQDELQKKMDDLKKEASELKELQKDAKMEDSEEVKKFAEALEKNDAEKNMEKSSKSMQQSDKEQSKSEGKEAEKKLADMLEKMQKEQMAMQSKSNEQMARAIREAIDNSNTVSGKQEELMSQTAEAMTQTMNLQNLAADQQELAATTEALKQQIAHLAKSSPFISGELSRMLAGAQEEMKSATDFLSRKNAQAGSTRQRDAMGEINKATAKLMESLDQQKQCNNPSNNSCSNGMPQLDALSKKQQKLNEETKGMCQNPGGKMGKNGTPQNGNSEATQRMKEGLKRLAGEQGQIRKQMEELQKEFGNSRQLLGRLDDIAREMGQVEEDLSDGEPGEETADRQLKILSRMLEATRSLQRRDFNPDRQASTATTNPVYLPPDLAGELGDDQRFEDRLKQFLGEGYPQQYEAQIKAYFRALLEAERSRQSTGSAQ